MPQTYAGVGRRSLAFALDYIIIAAYLGLVIILGVTLNAGLPALSRTLFGNPITGQISGFLSVTLPVTLYFAVLESSAWQASWGKRRLGLQVIGSDAGRLSFARALGRTALKFIPWELSHTCIWQIQFAEAEAIPLISAGFGLVWLLIGANLLSLWRSPTHQALHDWLAGTYVVRAGATSRG